MNKQYDYTRYDDKKPSAIFYIITGFIILAFITLLAIGLGYQLTLNTHAKKQTTTPADTSGNGSADLDDKSSSHHFHHQ